MRPDGSEKRKVTDGFGSGGWTPDGEWVIAQGTDGSLWKYPVEGGTAEQLTTEPANPLVVWSRDGETMYMGRTVGTTGIWARSMTDGTEWQVVDFEGRAGSLNLPSLTTDGEYFYFSWRETLGDIWVMDVVE